MKLKCSKKFSPQSLDLQAVYDSFGGTNKCAKKFKLSKQLLSLWKKEGRVPLYKVAEISKLFGVSPFRLNFEQVGEICDVAAEWGWDTDDN